MIFKEDLERICLQENEWTITAEWDLVCERAFLAPLITTTYFCGVMVSSTSILMFCVSLEKLTNTNHNHLLLTCVLCFL